MKKKYIPYGFDEKYEYRTYKNIGKDFKRLYRAQNNICYKLFYKLRRRKGEKRYTSFNTYSEWRTYVICQIESKWICYPVNLDNFIAFLKGRKRMYKVVGGMSVGIFLPIYMALVTGATAILFPVLKDFEDSLGGKLDLTINFWLLFGAILTLILIFMYQLNRNIMNHYYFFKDYIKIYINYKEENSLNQIAPVSSMNS